MNNELDLSQIRSEEELKDALERFREKHGISIVEPSYDKCRWCEENLQKYLETARTRDTKPTQVRMFYVPANGSVRQNNLLIQCVVWLQKTHWLGQQHLDQILEYTPPLLRLSTMVEKSPGDCDFIERTFDLIQTAIDCQAKDVLEQLLPYIDFSLYNQEAIYSILEQTQIDND